MFEQVRGYIRLHKHDAAESFRDTFSPSRIFAQIVLLQIFYYSVAFILFYFTASVAGYTFDFGWIFSWELISFGNTLGWTLSLLWLIDSLICVMFMTVIVGRSKLAWDFALTIHAVNLPVCWLYSGSFPKHAMWWFLQSVSSALMVGLGTWTTRWKELRETFFEGLLDPETGRVADIESAKPSESIPMQNLQPE
ncbi:unnamed protein product [Kuraishia capsulata CBS 1993]|uniref:Protein SYS1 n=1 Tax=Kuraishia capsulata CBS 1993 TaxID=1382522 RepID=W6MI06_9ASCO|nr:uncharacterized protein KUCA_T00001681001 [Kuraishia capsulata CBS 1993]CDK25711.1 unnamed protein product [Kuraishia capsulata CBS 1993]